MGSHIAPPPLQTEKHSSSDQGWSAWPVLTRWQARSVACLRIVFGLVWAVAAWLKWQPAFQSTFVDQIAGARDGQLPAVQVWISWWSSLVSINPLFFARLEASLETSLAVLLILGLLNNFTCITGMLLSLAIWSTAEGFGAPYQPGKSTDVGTALPYVLLFALLFVLSAGGYYGMDRWLTPRLGRLKILASESLYRRGKSKVAE